MITLKEYLTILRPQEKLKIYYEYGEKEKIIAFDMMKDLKYLDIDSYLDWEVIETFPVYEDNYIKIVIAGN